MSYGRLMTVRVGDLEIVYEDSRDLRMAFDVSRSRSRDPNAAAITIFNLAPETRASFEQQERVFCELEAGYKDESTFNIFAGVLLDVQSIRSDGGFATQIELGDDTEQKAAIPRIHKAFKTGTLVSNVLRELVKATGLKGGNLAEASISARLAGETTLTRPWLATGQAVGELYAFCRSLGFQFTLQDQQVIFTGLGRGSGGSGPLFTSENVPESPQIDAEGNISLVGRLVPELLPGQPFEVATERAEGVFVATETRHFGDTSGQDWSVAVTGEPLEKSVSRGLVINGA